MKILLVDDEFTTLAIAQKILKQLGYTVFTAENGVEALDVIRTEDIQVILSDWNMPEMDGLELCRYLRAQPSVDHLFFIMMTSRDSQGDKLAAIDAGANEILTKPIDAAELQVRLRSAERYLNMPSFSMVIHAMGLIAEAKDSDTGGHINRIQEFVRVLAGEMLNLLNLKNELPPHYVDLICDASPGHDLGKVSIPDYVLLKPEGLNDEEWRLMKTHAEDGARRLERFLIAYPNADIIRIAQEIALAHHERWDGTGYPCGLRGEEIPLSARIVALADVYDALTSKRVYKSAMPHEVARGIIIQSSGTHFDPQVVQAFLATEHSFADIHKRLNN
jgi:putative two-component system response regulator